MKPVLLLIGHSGLYGTEFCNLYRDKFHIVGMSRRLKPIMSDIEMITGDAGTEIARVFGEIAQVHGSISHVIHAAHACNMRGVGELDMENAVASFQHGLFSLFELGKLMHDHWRDGFPHTLTVISSLSGLNLYPNQLVYHTLKAAQLHAARYLADHFKNTMVRVNSISPTAFPTRIPTSLVCKKTVDLIESRANGLNLVLNET
jgi:NAD(P)-dependent dehydrogenase (short-subunit alcohol dehydrogenase family)